MPPKKGSSKTPAKARTPTLIDGLTKEEMTKEQMEEHVVRLREELEREREERNYFQQERDKIRTFYEVTERQVEEAKAELKKLDKDIEKDEQRHQVEIKVYKQKMKHLLCEHQNMTSELKADAVVSTQVQQKEQGQLESQLDNDKKDIMVDIQKLDNENVIKELEWKHGEEITETRNRLEKQLTEIETKYEEKMELLKQELENKRKHVISEREHLWSSHINSLKENHNKALAELNALTDGIRKELDVNRKLTAQLNEESRNQDERKRDLARVLQENKRLAERERNVKEEIAAIEKKLKYFRPKKDVTENVKQKKLDKLKCDHETLKQAFSKLQIERDEVCKSCTQNIQLLQQKGDQKNALLERKLQEMTDRLEETEAQLSSLLSAPGADQAALSEIMKNVGEKFDSMNNSIKNLQRKKAQISQARKDFLLNLERTLGVPVDEHGKPVTGL